jgi:hypothetical protein
MLFQNSIINDSNPMWFKAAHEKIVSNFKISVNSAKKWFHQIG